jgi:osmotically-inducible protein OsmY
LPTLNRSFTRLGAGTLASLQALQALDVQIINVAGHVTLKGHAGSLEAKAQLIDAVRHIPGVANVVDQVTVP